VFFKALACDYDGTLASEDRIGPAVRQALGRARKAGLRVILVTRRTFFELTRVCDCLELFDVVIAENGAVLYYPGSAMIRDQGPPVPGRLLAELDRRGISYQVGRVIVGTARGDEGAVTEALAAAGVTRDRVCNRAALMLLPVGVSKGSGVQQALRALDLSAHDVLALGDAENDLPLFDACGFSGCPGDSLPAVQERVDWVFPGLHGDGIASAITGQILADRLAVQHSPRQQIPVGWATATSEPVAIPARGVNVLIHGDPHSGKSWLAGALVERLVAARYSVCVVDPEGDYRVLARLPGVVWTEVQEPKDVDRALDGLLRDPAASAVLDLSTLPHAAKVAVIERALRKIRETRRSVGRPHWTLIEEAHYSLHDGGVPADALGVEDRGFCFVTYRPSWLGKQVPQAVDVFVLARTTDSEELAVLGSILPAALREGTGIAEAPARLPRGAFLLVRRDPDRHLSALTFVALPRETVHVRHLTKYEDSCVPPGREFLFRGGDGSVLASADSLNAFRRMGATVSDDVLGHHAEHGDFSAWVRDVFADAELARQLRKIEARWRRRELADLRETIDALITVRYGADD